MECIYRHTAWDEAFKILYSITYTFTLFSEITKLDHFVEHHNIYTKEFFDVQIHLTSPLFLEQFFKEPFIVKKRYEYPLPSCCYQEQQRCSGAVELSLLDFKQRVGPLQKPLLQRREPQLLCPSAIRGSRVPGLLRLECVTSQSLRHCSGLARFEDGV